MNQKHDADRIFQITTIPISGMTCESCTNSVTTALTGMEGVQNAVVSLTKENATITYDQDILARKDIIEAIEDAGFDVPEEKKSLEHDPVVDKNVLGTSNNSNQICAKNDIIAVNTEERTEKRDDSARDTIAPMNENPMDASGAALSCCLASSLGDLGKIAESSSGLTSNKYGGASNYPDSSVQIGLGVVTAIAGLCGACASLETFTSASDHVKRLKEAIAHVGTIRDAVGNTEGLEAVEIFLNRQLRKSRFVKWVPGATSASASTTLGIGGVVLKASPVGLALACVDGLAHVGETTRLIHEHGKNKKFLEAQIAEMRYHRSDHAEDEFASMEDQLAEVKKDLSNCRKRRLGAAASAVGTGLLLPVSVGVYGAAAVKSPYLIAAALVTLAAGLVLSLAYNPYKDLGWRREFSDRLSTFAEEVGDDGNIDAGVVRDFFDNRLRSELADKLRLSQNMQHFAKRYQKELNDSIGKSQHYKNNIKKAAGKVSSGGLSFLASPITLLGGMGRLSRDRYISEALRPDPMNTMDKAAQFTRRGAAFLLTPFEKAGNFLRETAASVDRGTQDSIVGAFKDASNRRMRVLSNLPGYEREPNQQEDHMWGIFTNHPEIRSEVMKGFAGDALRADGTFRAPYGHIFGIATPGELEKIRSALQEIRREAETSPCCPVSLKKLDPLRQFHDQYLSDATHSAQERAFSTFLTKSLDKYAFFGDKSASDGRFYSRFLGAYNTVQGRHSKRKSTGKLVDRDIASRDVRSLEQVQESNVAVSRGRERSDGEKTTYQNLKLTLDTDDEWRAWRETTALDVTAAGDQSPRLRKNSLTERDANSQENGKGR